LVFLTQFFQTQQGQIGDTELQGSHHYGLALFVEAVVVGFGDAMDQFMRAEQLQGASDAAGSTTALLGIGLEFWEQGLTQIPVSKALESQCLVNRAPFIWPDTGAFGDFTSTVWGYTTTESR
jgi:hypothetical protein